MTKIFVKFRLNRYNCITHTTGREMVAKLSILFCFGDVIDPLSALFSCVVFRYFSIVSRFV
ncbi:hypothetical protein GCA01S_044_00250 [Parageobacillus caldoxylosilyticus NBRC 107762]|uniref:Uncharacterized protein n=2 Tax=Saccharococcus caldoxylosilyticus TaxID=81408 RepID=A0A023DGM1_9BACL|nr:hypothetical protein GCA01S_044_00250 [Parageobacillus caldoxylosilyticus NBRC 107762]